MRASVAGGKIRLSGPSAVNRIARRPRRTLARPTRRQPFRPGPRTPEPAHSSAFAPPAARRIPRRIRWPRRRRASRFRRSPCGRAGRTPRPGRGPCLRRRPLPCRPPAPRRAGPGGEPMPNFRSGLGKDARRDHVPHVAPAAPVPSHADLLRAAALARVPAARLPGCAARRPGPRCSRTASRWTTARSNSAWRPSCAACLPLCWQCEPSSVPDDVHVTLPFALIEPQLSQGRVIVPRETFLQAMPEAHRHLLSGDGGRVGHPAPAPGSFPEPARERLVHSRRSGGGGNRLVLSDALQPESGRGRPAFCRFRDRCRRRAGKPPAPDAPAAPVTPPEPLRTRLPHPDRGWPTRMPQRPRRTFPFDTIRAVCLAERRGPPGGTCCRRPPAGYPARSRGETAPAVLRRRAFPCRGNPPRKYPSKPARRRPPRTFIPTNIPSPMPPPRCRRCVTPEPVAAAVEPALPPVDLHPSASPPPIYVRRSPRR